MIVVTARDSKAPRKTSAHAPMVTQRYRDEKIPGDVSGPADSAVSLALEVTGVSLAPTRDSTLT
jgi:hypothetical protein